MSLENNLLKKILEFKKQILNMIPTAGENTPSTDVVNGNTGTSTNYARSDHQHPLSSAYATASHTHTESDITNLGDYVEKSNTSGLIKNDGTIDTTQYISQHQDISGKLDIAQTSHKGKNVVVDGTTGNIAFENKPTVPTKISDLTNDSDFIEKSNTGGLVKNDGTIDTTQYVSDVSSKLDIAQTSYKGKNVVVDSSTGDITFEDKPTIPDVSGKIDTAGTGLTKSSTTLSADIGGSSSTSGSKLVACNDTRLSDARTPTSHNHNLTDVNNTATVTVTITYTDDSTETVKLVKYTGN